MKYKRQKRLGALAAFLLFVCLCATVFWGEPVKILIFSLFFGLPVLLGIGQKNEHSEGMFSGGITILVISFAALILIFQVGVYPVLTAVVAAAFAFTARWASATIEEAQSPIDTELE